uniref:Transthyretin/hydroxyisourate hydrolase domain-containing protein n=1 Tax=Oncorhynchus mykiss TaxID=8022 RepID=A0A8C7S6X9_ONCMY
MVKSVTICLYWWSVCSVGLCIPGPVLCVWLVMTVLLCVTVHGLSDAQCPLMVKILHAVKGVPAGSMARSVSRQDTNGMIRAQVASRMTDVTTYWKSQGTTHFHNTAELSTIPNPSARRDIVTTPWPCWSPFSYTTTAVVINAHTPDQA